MGYNSRYANGVIWDYDRCADNENMIIREFVVRPTGLTNTGARCLEVGCGQGWHADALRKRGLKVVAVDSSPAAIRYAKARYQFASVDFLCRDGAELIGEFADGTFDMLFCRGLSWHHYCLDDAENQVGVNPVKATSDLLEIVKLDGFFCLQICTDFSGITKPGKVWQNTLKEYVNFMSRFGEIIHCCDWRGRTLNTKNCKAPVGASGIIITGKKG